MKTCNKKVCNNQISVDKNCNIVINDDTFNCNFILVFILKHNATKNTQTIIKESRNLRITFTSKGDGFYTLCKLTVPIDEAQPYYYKNNKFYNNIEEIPLLRILNENPEVSGIKTEYFYYFSTCNLRKCFILICLNIFKQSTSICNKANIDESIIYKRDLIWSALNVIQYMVEMDQMEEAQRLLEEISGCNGLCSSYTKINDCGCRK